MIEDEKIIEMFFGRSEQGIRELDIKYGKVCHKLSYNIVNSRQDAEECVNDTYHATWNTLPPERPNYFFAYLAKLARNFSFGKYDYYHAQKRCVTVVELSDEIENCIPAPNDLEQKLDSKEIGRIISTFLYEQSSEMRAVFVRRYWYMDPIKDIAEMFQISESKVKSILFRMRNKLREHLEEEDIHL